MFLQLQAGGSTHLTTATLRASHSTWHTAPWTFAAHWRPRGPGKHVGETARATARFDLSLASPEIRGRTADGTEMQRKSASNVASALQTVLTSSQTTATGRSLVCNIIMDLPLLRFKQGTTLPDLAEAPSAFFPSRRSAVRTGVYWSKWHAGRRLTPLPCGGRSPVPFSESTSLATHRH